MIKFYELLFFHIYKSLIKSPDEFYKYADKSISSLVSLMVLTFVEFTNVLALISFLDLLGLNIFDFLYRLDLGYWKPIIIMMVLYFINILIMFKKGRYMKVINGYSKKSLEERKRGARITLVYGFGSVLLLFISGFLRLK